MASDATDSGKSGTVVFHRWSARRVRPIILLYVAAVFAAFMVLAYFVFHSIEAVKALAIAAVGTLVATAPAVIDKLEYQLTDVGLDKRTLRTKNPGPFTEVFCWHELSHMVPLEHGFKFYKPLPATGPLRRFWNAQISDQYSGEVHVEKSDLDRVLGAVAGRGIPAR